MANNVWRVALSDGRDVVVKGGRSVPDGFFAQEAESLEALRDIGGLPTPQVLHVGAKSLVLESMSSELPDAPQFWEAAGRAVATLHDHGSSRTVGTTTCAGPSPQENSWMRTGSGSSLSTGSCGICASRW